MTEKKKEKKMLLGIFNILPEDEDTDLDKLVEKTKEVIKPFDAELQGHRIQEVAYGLKKIIAHIIFPEMDGGTEPLENALMDMGDVQRAECEMVSNYSTSVKM
jgi:elongation factor 1-beta